MHRIVFGLLLVAATSAWAGEPYAIEVVDSRTGRGVPLVELRTVNDIRLVTDSRGVAAFDEPGLMGRSVFFHVSSPGYEFPKDGFGFRGQALPVVAGGRGRLAIERINISERLYRITGAGVYRDSLLVGDRVPTTQPVLNAQVLGSDSVLNAVFRGQVHWFWGDTNRPGYPLGNFHTPTATSKFPGDGGLDIEQGIDLDYAVDPEGFAAPSARLPGDGPTWLDALTVLKDSSGTERMFAAYAKIRPPMEAYERGLVEFDPATRRFSKVATIPLGSRVYPTGHPLLHREHVYFADAFPLSRVRATVDDLTHPERTEAFTCLLPDGTIDRGAEGRARYAWRRDASVVDGPAQAKLIREGKLRQDEALLHLQDPETGRRVVAHKGSTYWNPYRGRWVMIAPEVGGESSYLGEIWLAEADTLLGPWVYARKIVTHTNYTFYNPKQHPEFARQGGRVIFFEGTYTTTFSGNDHPTPRYDYNQILYKVDLADPRLQLPVPIYEADGPFLPNRSGQQVSFFALEAPGPGTVPIGEPARFHGLALDLKTPPPPTTTILYQSSGKEGGPVYFTAESRPPGDARAVARVWRNPLRLILPPG